MGNPAHGGWSYRGYAYHHQAGATNVRTLHALTKDTTNNLRNTLPLSSYVNNDAAIMSIEAYFDTLAGGAASVTFTLWRDAAGDMLLVGAAAVNITIGTTTATDGSARVTFSPEIDHHRMVGSVDGDSDQNVTLYVGIQLNAGTANANILCNWASATGGN